MLRKIILTAFLLLVGAACAPSMATPEALATEPPASEKPPVDVSLLTPTLPPTDIPTPAIPTPGTPVVETWTGKPNYPESAPGMLYQLAYDANRWAFAEDQFGQTVLSHLLIDGCILSPTVGRGLPPNYIAESTFRNIRDLQFEVVTISENRIPRSINYFGGDGIVFTGFQLSFQGYPEVCIQEAEAVLATLVSVPENP
jgi:hypothetical protein